MEPLTMAALATAAQSSGEVVTNFMNQKNARRVERQRRNYDMKNWHAQNRYNSPAAQMQRLKDAGLNPNLIYGGSPGQAAGTAQAVPEGKAAAPQITNPLSSMGRIADFPIKQAQIDNLEATAEVNKQRAILLGVETAGKATQNAKGELELGLAQELRETSLQMGIEELKFMEQKTIGLEIQNQVSNATKAAEVLKIYYQAAQAREQLFNLKKTGANIDKQGEILDLEKEFRSLDTALRASGIQPGDPLWQRILGSFYNQLRENNPSLPKLR